MPQSAVDRHTARRRAATSMAATELVGDVARVLGERGITVMPLKGALLQHWLYDDPAERPLSDVDLLVRAGDLPDAVDLLKEARYRPTSHAIVDGLVMETRFGLLLDLHTRLFDQARYRIFTDDLFARGSDDTNLFGAPVRIPCALDVYAHLIGKFGSDHLDARAEARLDELGRMGSFIAVSPGAAALHLGRCGMRRVSRYVLPLVHETTGDSFARKVVDCLPLDPLGRSIAAVTSSVLAGAPPRSRMAALMAHLMNDSLPRGLRSGVRALRQQARS